MASPTVAEPEAAVAKKVATNQKESYQNIALDPDIRDAAAKAAAAARQAAIEKLGLEKYVVEMEENGYTVVPPEVTGLTPAMIEEMQELLCQISGEKVGCKFSVDGGPECDLDFGGVVGGLELQSKVEPSQIIVSQLCKRQRIFRDLAVNPVSTLLMRLVLGQNDAKFSSHNAIVKWKGEGYGDTLGLHVDQGALPTPWGETALNANCNWAMTDYTKESGCVAVVPGSHKHGCHPKMPEAIKQAIPIECPKGSLIAWHGALWHGAYPKRTEGLRLTIVNFYRHQAVMPQDAMAVEGVFPKELAEDCSDPKLFKRLAAFGAMYTVSTPHLPKPKKLADDPMYTAQELAVRARL